MKGRAFGDCVVAGIDVGGERKGFHAVVLGPGGEVETLNARGAGSVDEVVACCEAAGVTWVAVDAPCRWRDGDAMRLAERELAARHARIRCFPTPTRDVAAKAPGGFFGWMLRGAALFAALEVRYPLWNGGAADRGCFETFPQAVACHLVGRLLPASGKRVDRRRLLRDAGVATTELRNQDLVDAGLCAVAARAVAGGGAETYGDAAGGLLVVPRWCGVSPAAQTDE